MILIVLPDITTEDELLTQVRQGKRAAIRQVYQVYFPPLYQFIRLRVADAPTAEDLASTVFVRLVESIGQGNAPHHSLRGWLFQVARNELQRHYGKLKGVREVVLEEWLPAATEDNPEAQFIYAAGMDQTRRAMRMLAEDQQEVLILRFSQALTLQETATLMGKSVGAVKQLQYRAINTLRHILGETRTERA